MTALAIVAAVALAVQALVMVRILIAHDRERMEWSRERQELCTRITHPQIVPAPVRADEPEPEPQEPSPGWDAVGLVVEREAA